jgi:preprotein translocase subunit SecF
MAIYILVAFIGVREYFAPWIFAVVTILTLAHDVIMAAGGYGIRMMFNQSVVVNTIFVMAILTVLGYSINDTIIIFDRIRENIIKYHDQVRQ